MKSNIFKNFNVLMLVLAIMLSSLGGMVLPQDKAIAKGAAGKISKKSLELTVGQSKTLKVTGIKGKIKWSTSKKKVATVTAKGKVTAKKAGSATITAKVKGKKFTCKVKVKNKKTKPAATAKPTKAPKPTATAEPTTEPKPTTTVEPTPVPPVNTVENNFAILKNYIITNGNTNSDGNKFIRMDVEDTASAIIYDSANKKFEFICYLTSNSADSVLTLDIKESDISSGSLMYLLVFDSGLHGECTAQTSINSLGSAAKLNWVVETSNIPSASLKDVADSAYKVGYSSWDLLILVELGMSITDFGFKN